MPPGLCHKHKYCCVFFFNRIMWDCNFVKFTAKKRTGFDSNSNFSPHIASLDGASQVNTHYERKPHNLINWSSNCVRLFDDSCTICMCQVQFDRWLRSCITQTQTHRKSANRHARNRILFQRQLKLNTLPYSWNDDDDAFDCKPGLPYYKPIVYRQVFRCHFCGIVQTC